MAAITYPSHPHLLCSHNGPARIIYEYLQPRDWGSLEVTGRRVRDAVEIYIDRKILAENLHLGRWVGLYAARLSNLKYYCQLTTTIPALITLRLLRAQPFTAAHPDEKGSLRQFCAGGVFTARKCGGAQEKTKFMPKGREVDYAPWMDKIALAPPLNFKFALSHISWDRINNTICGMDSEGLKLYSLTAPTAECMRPALPVPKENQNIASLMHYGTTVVTLSNDRTHCTFYDLRNLKKPWSGKAVEMMDPDKEGSQEPFKGVRLVPLPSPPHTPEEDRLSSVALVALIADGQTIVVDSEDLDEPDYWKDLKPHTPLDGREACSELGIVSEGSCVCTYDRSHVRVLGPTINANPEELDFIRRRGVVEKGRIVLKHPPLEEGVRISSEHIYATLTYPWLALALNQELTFFRPSETLPMGNYRRSILFIIDCSSFTVLHTITCPDYSWGSVFFDGQGIACHDVMRGSFFSETSLEPSSVALIPKKAKREF